MSSYIWDDGNSNGSHRNFYEEAGLEDDLSRSTRDHRVAQTSSRPQENRSDKPGALSIQLGIIILVIASLVFFINTIASTHTAPYVWPSSGVLLGAGAMPLGVFLVIAGYLHRISTALAAIKSH